MNPAPETRSSTTTPRRPHDEHHRRPSVASRGCLADQPHRPCSSSGRSTTPADGDERVLFAASTTRSPTTPTGPARPLNKPLPYPKISNCRFGQQLLSHETDAPGFDFGHMVSRRAPRRRRHAQFAGMAGHPVDAPFRHRQLSAVHAPVQPRSERVAATPLPRPLPLLRPRHRRPRHRGAAVDGDRVTEIFRLYVGRGLRADPFGDDDEKLEVASTCPTWPRTRRNDADLRARTRPGLAAAHHRRRRRPRARLGNRRRPDPDTCPGAALGADDATVHNRHEFGGAAMTTRFIDHLLVGIIADRPAATAVPAGTLYSSTDEAMIYQVRRHQLGRLGRLPRRRRVATDAIFDAKGDLVAATAADTAARLGGRNQRPGPHSRLGRNNRDQMGGSCRSGGIVSHPDRRQRRPDRRERRRHRRPPRRRHQRPSPHRRQSRDDRRQMGDTVRRRSRRCHPPPHDYLGEPRHLRPGLDQRQLQRPDPGPDRQRHRRRRRDNARIIDQQRHRQQLLHRTHGHDRHQQLRQPRRGVDDSRSGQSRPFPRAGATANHFGTTRSHHRRVRVHQLEEDRCTGSVLASTALDVRA